MPNDIISTLIETLRDKKSLDVKETIHNIAHLETNVLVYGETGVGKDAWIDYLHSLNAKLPFLRLHCGDVPENLLESEWFGFKQGAFTGALQDREGKWTAAEGGILYLNQIDLLTLNLQAKLLRIIERKKYYPLGSGEEKEIHARFIFSADHDIEEKVRNGQFREDLYYRISAYKIQVPPLRDRKNDILPLTAFFATKNNLELDLDIEAQNTLTDYGWRGNIRELENFISSLAVGRTRLTGADIFGLLGSSDDFFDTVKDREMSMAQLEMRYIDYLLRKYKSKVTVARILKISRKSLYNKLNKKS